MVYSINVLSNNGFLKSQSQIRHCWQSLAVVHFKQRYGPLVRNINWKEDAFLRKRNEI